MTIDKTNAHEAHEQPQLPLPMKDRKHTTKHSMPKAKKKVIRKRAKMARRVTRRAA